MKTKFTILLCCILFIASAYAQETNNVSDSIATTEKSSVTYDGASYSVVFAWKKKQAYEPHWTGFGMAFIGFSDLEGADLARGSSYSFTFNPIDYYIPIYRNWLFVTGAGIDWSRYHFKGDIGLADIGTTVDFEPAPDGIHYRSSKLLAYYITIPLLIEYQKKISKKQSFYISGGAVGYIKCYSKSQVEYSDTKKQVNLGRDLNILPVNARFMLQVGIEDVSAFAYYSPFSIIENGKGPELRPYGIGMRLNF